MCDLTTDRPDTTKSPFTIDAGSRQSMSITAICGSGLSPANFLAMDGNEGARAIRGALNDVASNLR
ncbi:MAG: hypothetical protein K2W81_00450 [Sphingomonas sp.]|uniref:hypothetical protein n=1 Tax=Sphingomonas sp. TaxID=28214 RepID=UPI0025ED4790|nr:hypothetical protein [Sphingomonas sp.]MBY0282411.1 hypothetical protein [Sphingomonas sp.]